MKSTIEKIQYDTKRLFAMQVLDFRSLENHACPIILHKYRTNDYPRTRTSGISINTEQQNMFSVVMFNSDTDGNLEIALTRNVP